MFYFIEHNHLLIFRRVATIGADYLNGKTCILLCLKNGIYVVRQKFLSSKGFFRQDFLSSSFFRQWFFRQKFFCQIFGQKWCLSSKIQIKCGITNLIHFFLHDFGTYLNYRYDYCKYCLAKKYHVSKIIFLNKCVFSKKNFCA